MYVPSPLALVAPRALIPGTSDSLPLLDLVSEQIETKTRTIRLTGEGKTQALAYLASELGHDPRIRFLENVSISQHHPSDLTIIGSGVGCRADLEFKLAGWSQDEVIEYLIAKAPDRCQSVMSRLAHAKELNGFSGLRGTGGSPRVISLVLDQMIESDSPQCLEEAVAWYFESLNLTRSQAKKIIGIFLKDLFNVGLVADALVRLAPRIIDQETVKQFTCQPVRMALVARHIALQLGTQLVEKTFESKWPDSLIERVGRHLGKNENATQCLEQLANQALSRNSPNAVNLLVRADPDWRPKRASQLNLDSASLADVNWDNVSLVDASMMNANFLFASLQRANLQKAVMTSARFNRANLALANMSQVFAWRANFSQATLQGVTANRASFKSVNFEDANLTHADFSETSFFESNLTSANLSNSNFSRAKFDGANLDQANFSHSDLSFAKLSRLDLRSTCLDGACFKRALMVRCDLEGVKIQNSQFRGAVLLGAIMTGSQLRNCTLMNCELIRAKLADIDWEGCDLRNACFDGCHFLMGSTRSGTVDSPYPSHGTRTGYYTDDFDDHYFKQPEEIRKANLCGCNLLGAKVVDADFYLVDLRGAQYDDQQRLHFQRCGAILHD